MTGNLTPGDRAFRLVAIPLIAVLAFAHSARAQVTLVVDDDGQATPASCDDATGTFASVGLAIAAAANGDTVLVCPGTYIENVNFAGKAITLKSVNGPDVTILDGNAADSVVTFATAEESTAVLDGFTIRNGRSGFDTPGFGAGGGIRIQDASPTVRGNAIVHNQACNGAGISVSFGSPLIEGNRITDNTQAGCSGGIGGGGISVGGSAAAQIRQNTIANNVLTSADGGGISLFAAGTPIIDRNVISGNSVSGRSPCAAGGGIAMFNDSDATISGNLIVGNSAGCGGGVYWLVPSGARGPLLVNNTIVDNDSVQGSAIFADGFDVSAELVNNNVTAFPGQTAVFCGDFNDVNAPVFRFNNVFSSSGPSYGGICSDQTGVNGNISVDPQFVDAGAGNYHLSPTSPAIDTGDNQAPELPPTDIDGDARVADGTGDGEAVVDIGADEFAGSAPPSHVVIDVEPGNPQNVVNPRSAKVLRIAIMSLGDFDATTVDPSTIRIGSAAAPPIGSESRDLNGDGVLDLLLRLQTRASGIHCDMTSIVLTGQTFGGTAFIGEDDIRLAGCH
jgi:parallel beta-helix repeat protein